MARSLVFAGVELHPDGSVRHRGEWQDTSACHAEVQTAGQVRDRATLTRVAGGALVAGPVGAIVGGLLRKRVDEQQGWLLITGDRHDWVVQLRPDQLGDAQQFAITVNNAAREQQQKEAEAAAPAVQPYRRNRGVYRPGLR